MQRMTKIPRIHKEPKPDPSWEIVGHHPETHRPIYRELINTSRPRPKLDEDGNRVFRVNKLTGEELYPLNEMERVTLDRTFHLVSDGQANIYKEFYSPPTAEELAEQERAKKIEAAERDLATALVDAGLTPAELIAQMTGKAKAAAPVAPPAPKAPEPVVVEDDDEPTEYPEMYAPGRWRLSNGDTMQGKREDAEAAEAALKG